MFINTKKMSHQLKELGERIAQLEQQLADTSAENRVLSNHATLISIQREGRTLKLVFLRNGAMFTIETVAMMSDNMAEWKRLAGL